MAYGSPLGNPLGNPLGIPRSAISSVSAVGTVLTHAGAAAENELPADGRSLLKANYSALYNAIGDSYTQAFTTNPTITTPSLPSSTTWIDVAYGAGLFIAISSGGITAVSSDFGATWQAGGSLPAATYMGIAYGGGIFVAVATGVAFSVSSADGITWTQRTMPAANNWSCLAYGNGRFVAYASNGTAYSMDGVLWVAGGAPGPTYSTGKIAFGSGRFVVGDALNISSQLATTTDGITWTASTLPSSRRVRGLAYGNGFFTITSNTSAQTLYSWDGLTWIAGASSSSNLLLAFYYGRFFFFPLTGVSVTNLDYPDKFGAAITSPGNAYGQAYAVGGGYMVVLSNVASAQVARFFMLTQTNFNIPNLQALDPDKTAFVRVS